VIRTEEAEGRYVVVLDDVHGADITGLEIENAEITGEKIKSIHSSGINYE